MSFPLNPQDWSVKLVQLPLSFTQFLILTSCIDSLQHNMLCRRNQSYSCFVQADVILNYRVNRWQGGILGCSLGGWRHPSCHRRYLSRSTIWTGDFVQGGRVQRFVGIGKKTKPTIPNLTLQSVTNVNTLRK